MSTPDHAQKPANDHARQRVRQPDAPVSKSVEQQPAASALIQRAQLNPRLLTPRDILQLQRTIGNTAVQNLLKGTTVHPTIQRMIDKEYSTRVNNLAQLNAALGRLNPQLVNPPALPAYNLATFGVPGAHPRLLDMAIAQSNSYLYDSMAQADVVGDIQPILATLVNTQPAASYTSDPHGDAKHFIGGTGKNNNRFTGTAATINPLLVAAITAEIGRIRRHANGANRNYAAFIMAPNQYSQGYNILIQVDYNYATDSIVYHGYPDNTVGQLQPGHLSISKASANLP